MNQKKHHSSLSDEEFKQLVVFFAWLKMIRDRVTKGDTFEPLNELSSGVDEVKEELLEKWS